MIALDTEKRSTLQGIRDLYKEELYEHIIPFWERYSLDHHYGGYLTCLDHDGTVYDYDKFMWMQGREIWMFSHLYNRVQKEERWLQGAKLGYEFCTTYSFDSHKRVYFALSREGVPLIAPYNIYSDCFLAMACAEYALASGNDEALALGKDLYSAIQKRKDNPKGVYNKVLPSGRSFRAFGFSMIQIGMAQVFNRCESSPVYQHIIEKTINDILTYHISVEDRIVWERVALDGSHPNCMEGRLLCPGHACEVIWFIAQEAITHQNTSLITTLSEALLWTLQRGWDTTYGGIFYYQDAHNFPTEKVESEMKLWWVNVEALYATLLLYAATGDERHYRWFLTIHRWTWEHFRDTEQGEWYGYLHRDGSVAKRLKGGKWKGFFHLPRALLESIDTLENILGTQGENR